MILSQIFSNQCGILSQIYLLTEFRCEMLSQFPQRTANQCARSAHCLLYSTRLPAMLQTGGNMLIYNMEIAIPHLFYETDGRCAWFGGCSNYADHLDHSHDCIRCHEPILKCCHCIRGYLCQSHNIRMRVFDKTFESNQLVSYSDDETRVRFQLWFYNRPMLDSVKSVRDTRIWLNRPKAERL